MIDRHFGVSFSIKQCSAFGLDAHETLDWLIKNAGFGRFRMMSYWNEHEKEQGNFDFRELDWQIKAAQKAGAEVTLCLGARQPRWPENHWPDWAWKASKTERSKTLLRYIETVIERYKNYSCITSYQLENEALLEDFGRNSEVDRERLRDEHALVRQLDPSRPIVMTTSTSWGIPVRQPIPDLVGFSFYNVLYRKGAYHRSLFSPLVHKFRRLLIWLLHRKPVFVHELQLEPWGPTAIWKMDNDEQAKSMGPAHIRRNLSLAKRIGVRPIDLWGGEWWYWRLKHGDDSIWEAVRQSLK